MLSYPFTSQVTYDDEGLPLYDRAVDSKFLRKVYAKYFSDGVFFKPTNSLQVVADTGMQVVVEPGTCHIQGAIGIEETRRTLVVQASEEQDRIDTVVARLDFSLAVRSVDLYVVKGVAAESPQAPTLTRDATTWEIGLANLFVAKNTQTISQQRITDTRLDTDRCGQVTQAPGDFDTAPYFAQLQAAIDQYNKDTAAQLAEIQEKAEAQLADQAADLTAWFGVKDEEFTGWFETIKGKLGEDPAGSLQTQVEKLNAAVTGYPLKLTAGTNALQITAKRNSIESLAVEGFTKQAGSGDASPENVRAISVATKRLVKYVCTGQEAWTTSMIQSGKYRALLPSTALPVTEKRPTSSSEQMIVYSSFYKPATATQSYTGVESVSIPSGSGGIYIYDSNYELSDPMAWKQHLQDLYHAGTPLVIWYAPADISKDTGIYLPFERTDESGYNCDCIKLSADLCEGDKVDTCVKSGCDKRILLDGSGYWSATGANGQYYTDTKAEPTSNNSILGSVFSDSLPLDTAANGFNGAVSISINQNGNICVTLPDKAAPSSYFAEHPAVVYYRSADYTEENNIPIQREDHVKFYHVFDGTENITGYTDLGTVARVFVKDMPAIKSAYVGCVCNMFKTDTSYTGDYEHCYANKEPYFFVAKSRLSEQSNAGIKNYFASLYSAGTPVVMVYELAATAIYARDPVHIQTNDGATNVSTPEGCVLEIDVARNEAKEYAATLANAGWQSSGSEYTQTAEVKCVEGLGFVSPESSFDGVIWANQTEDLALNAELTEALGPINTGYLTLGDGTITCRVAEKPARDIEIHFKAKR